MFRESDLKPGRVFVVPLLGGGYAFGVITLYRKRVINLGNIFDYYSDDPNPPPDLAEKDILIYDMQYIGRELDHGDIASLGEAWWLTDMYIEGPATKIRTRYYVLPGPPPKRKDILGIEPNVPISHEEAAKYPTIGGRFSPYNAAWIEVELKRLDMTPLELIDKWRATLPRSKRGRPPLITEGPARICIAIPYEGEGLPGAEDLEKRDVMEGELRELEVGKITEVGAGMGVMEIFVETEDVKRSWRLLKKALKKLGWKQEKDVKLDTYPLDED